jgi:hypothetical protein
MATKQKIIRLPARSSAAPVSLAAARAYFSPRVLYRYPELARHLPVVARLLTTAWRAGAAVHSLTLADREGREVRLVAWHRGAPEAALYKISVVEGKEQGR